MQQNDALLSVNESPPDLDVPHLLFDVFLALVLVLVALSLLVHAHMRSGVHPQERSLNSEYLLLDLFGGAHLKQIE